MKKFYLVLAVPFLITGCGSNPNGINNNTQNDGFGKTHTVSDAKKGAKISNDEAKDVAARIATSMETKYKNNEDKFIEDATKFSYSFRNVIDDSIYISTSVNYDGEKEFFSQKATSRESGHGTSIMSNYEYVVEDLVYSVFVNQETGGYYYTYAKDTYRYNGIFSFLSELILECGNQMKNILSQMNSFSDLESMAGTGIDIEYRSSGEGNLYMSMNIPMSGMRLEAMFENYWLTYEYLYTDLSSLKQYMPEGYEFEYEKMVTELFIDFNEATVEYPDITNYRHYN